jgi:hypothetical protein
MLVEIYGSRPKQTHSKTDACTSLHDCPRVTPLPYGQVAVLAFAALSEPICMLIWLELPIDPTSYPTPPGRGQLHLPNSQ